MSYSHSSSLRLDIRGHKARHVLGRAILPGGRDGYGPPRGSSDALSRDHNLAENPVRSVISDVADRSIADTDEQLIDQILDVIKADPERPLKDPRLVSPDLVLGVERVSPELALDAMRSLSTREQLSDSRWP